MGRFGRMADFQRAGGEEDEREREKGRKRKRKKRGSGERREEGGKWHGNIAYHMSGNRFVRS
jgi:hypothetical protein